MNRWWLVTIAAGVMSFALGAPVTVAAEQEAGKSFVLTGPLVFPMEEVPAFGKEEVSGQVQYRYPRGQSVGCGPTSISAVKKYPELKSKRPLYGTVKFGGSPPDATSGTTFHFVLDEAGETYDLLYFDRNGDLDLTNDGVIRLTAKPVFEAMPAGPNRGLSGEIEMPCDFGPGVGPRSFPIAVAVYANQGSAYVSFLPKTVRRGKITLGEEQYVAVLSPATLISGRYDLPSTRLELMRVDRPGTTMRLRPGTLDRVRWIGEHLVSVSTTPLGDTLTIEPYRGDKGVLEIGPGGRTITELGLAGQLTSRTETTWLGSTPGVLSPLPERLPRRYTLPVGDYGLPSLTAQYGRVRFSARTASVRAPGSGSSSAKAPTYPVQIRKNERFLVEFSGKPEVVFMSPPKDKAFRPGDRVDVRAMLTEPWQGLQITGLWDTTRKQGETRYRMEGREVTVPQYVRLDPTIAIKNAAGEVVSEGKMPFG
jgi:hypothetical protein